MHRPDLDGEPWHVKKKKPHTHIFLNKITYSSYCGWKASSCKSILMKKKTFYHCLMRCLFAVSSWFVQRASLTVNIFLSDVTNRYYTVQYRTVVVYEKKKWSLVFSGSRKIPTLGSTVQWETQQASFPTGTVGPRVGIFLSQLNTNDGFYFSHIPTHTRSSDPNVSSLSEKSVPHRYPCEIT